MKNCIITIGLLLISIGLYAQSIKSFKSADQQIIVKILEDQRVAWNQGDINEFMQVYWKSDSLVFLGRNGPKYGWQNTLDNYKKSYPDKKTMGLLIFNIHEIRILSKGNAFVVGAWMLKRETDEPNGFFTLLLKKIKGEWKIVADHSS